MDVRPAVADTKNKLSQLLEINRALAHDLDVSQRQASELARERDGLLERVAELEEELQRLRSVKEAQVISIGGRGGPSRAPKQAAEEKRDVLPEFLQRSRAAAERAEEAETQLQRMIRRLRAVESERDEARSQLLESIEAMEEIKEHLLDIFDAGEASSYDLASYI